MKTNLKRFFLFVSLLGGVQGLTLWWIFGNQYSPLKLITSIISLGVIVILGMLLFLIKKEKGQNIPGKTG